MRHAQITEIKFETIQIRSNCYPIFCKRKTTGLSGAAPAWAYSTLLKVIKGSASKRFST